MLFGYNPISRTRVALLVNALKAGSASFGLDYVDGITSPHGRVLVRLFPLFNEPYGCCIRTPDQHQINLSTPVGSNAFWIQSNFEDTCRAVSECSKSRMSIVWIGLRRRHHISPRAGISSIISIVQRTIRLLYTHSRSTSDQLVNTHALQ
jgi:hypothetical protein